MNLEKDVVEVGVDSLAQRVRRLGASLSSTETASDHGVKDVPRLVCILLESRIRVVIIS